MLERFRENFEPDDKRCLGAVEALSRSASAELSALLEAFGGCSFRNALYRIVRPDEAALWRERIAIGFPDHAANITPFGYDWLGRAFVLDSKRAICGKDAVLMFEPGTAEVLEIPGNLESFHNDVVVDDAEAALAASFYENWRAAGGAAPNRDECIGYKIPLFFGGADEIENLELSDIDVYWHIHGQSILRVRSGKG